MVVFLGNPGRQYERTRHNAGWLVADALSFSSRLAWKEKFKGLVALYEGVAFLKPTTFMNRCGESVGACAAFYRVEPGQLLVVHDDLEIDFGRVELRSGGGLAGHNGLRDIVRVIGTRDFERLRFGISRPPHGKVSQYVLSRFSREEEPLVADLAAKAALLVESRTRGELS